VYKHSQPKTSENVLPWNPKTSSYSHPNPKVKKLLQWCQKNMSLLAQDMESNILNNESNRILNHIMCDSALSPMSTMK
jgi:hypothetical protein